ncbi:MAG: SusD/RagB family nutrient-binding outer membrane lipoprotein [Prevotella sp.]|nr:SusD/RagB family nutrient-binding outer membrane lipoprotein [Prevotella sp.]
MKRNYYIIVSFILFGMVLMSSCDDKFDSYNNDPNSSTSVTSSMLATNCIRQLWTTYAEPKLYMKNYMLSKYISWSEANDIDIAFNKLGRTNFTDMTMLYNIQKMVDNAGNDGLKNAYKGIGHVLRAIKFFDATLRVGDIPYSEAMQGEDGITNPKYDSQRDVLLGLLEELEEADRLLSNGSDFAGDIVYGGSCSQWRKAANVLELKILINLYNKTSDSELNVKGRFKNIVTGKPLFISNDDNLQLVHSDASGQKPEFYREGNNYVGYIQISSEVVDTLKALGDYRLFYYARPTPNASGAGKSMSDWDSYAGIESTMTEEEIQAAVNAGNVSQTNARYTDDVIGEPSVILSYSEMNFILAEACVRGLLDGNAKNYYEKGIEAAMHFTADNTRDNADFHHNMKITDEYISEYLKHQGVAFSSSSNRQIGQIIEQKYLATFLQQPFNGFYEYRRTGYPVLPINAKSNRNTPTTKMPARWMYPQAEYDYNGDNVQQAVQSQFGGNDDENQIMWLLK